MSCKMAELAVLVVVLLGALTLQPCEGGRKQDKEIEVMDSVLKNYDARIRPSGANSSDASGPTIVTINTFVRSISKIDDTNMEFSVQLTFRQSWVDDRFKFSSADHGLKYLTLNDASKIWVPDLFFSNEIQGFVHDLLTPNTYLRIFPEGRVLYSARVSMTLSCPMNLKWFPFDEQICNIRMASYGYTTEDLIFLWKEGDPVQVVKNLNLPRFNLDTFGTDYCNSKTTTGEYSCLKVTLHLKRELSYYLLNILIPSAMLVAVSWISFWLDHSAIMGRVLIGVTTLLTLALKTAAFNATLAPVSYTKSIDIWTGVCLTFIFVALLESAVVNYLARSEQKKRCKNAAADETVNGAAGEEELDLKPLMTPMTEAPKEGNGRQHTLTLKERACRYTRWVTTIPTCSKRLDIISRIVFPLTFIAFVVVYALANSMHCED